MVMGLQHDTFSGSAPSLGLVARMIMDRQAFVAMIKSLGIRHPHVQLSNITAHRSGSVGYIVYDRVESFESHGAKRVVPETGTIVFARQDGAWLIVLWTTTSPPG
jgi:ketosteroid isomerase-like protein